MRVSRAILPSLTRGTCVAEGGGFMRIRAWFVGKSMTGGAVAEVTASELRGRVGFRVSVGKVVVVRGGNGRDRARALPRSALESTRPVVRHPHATAQRAAEKRESGLAGCSGVVGCGMCFFFFGRVQLVG